MLPLHSGMPCRCPHAVATQVLPCCATPAQVSEARLIELLEQVSEQTEKKTKVGCGVRDLAGFST